MTGFFAEMEVKRRQGASNEIRGWVWLRLSVAALVMSIHTVFRPPH